jgi:hypothetical protein
MLLVLSGALVLALAPVTVDASDEHFEEMGTLGVRAETMRVAPARVELWHVDYETGPNDILAIEADSNAAWWYSPDLSPDRDGEARVAERLSRGTLGDGTRAVVLDLVTEAHEEKVLVCSVEGTPSCGEVDVRAHGGARARLRHGVLRIGRARYLVE